MRRNVIRLDKQASPSPFGAQRRLLRVATPSRVCAVTPARLCLEGLACRTMLRSAARRAASGVRAAVARGAPQHTRGYAGTRCTPVRCICPTLHGADAVGGLCTQAVTTTATATASSTRV